MSIDNLATDNALLLKYLEIQNGCQSWLLIATAKIVPVAVLTILTQLVLS